MLSERSDIRHRLDEGRIFVTGATGTLGAEVVSALVRRGRRVSVLIHRASELIDNAGRRLTVGRLRDGSHPGDVIGVPGDVTKPRLGLSESEYGQLQRTTDLVLHCAAITTFGRPAALYDAVNVEGTRHVIELATSSPVLIPLVHISTAYVCGTREGVIRECELDMGQSFANAYERSKFEAERLVRSAQKSGLSTVTVRPAIIIGRKRNGAIREFSNIYSVLRVLTAGHVTAIPAHYGAVLDLVEVDYVSDLIGAVIDDRARLVGRTFHAVGPRPITLREVSDVLAEYPCLRAPRLIPPESFDVRWLAARERGFYQKIVSLYEPYFRNRAHFDDTESRAVLERGRASGNRRRLRVMIDYALRCGFLGARSAQEYRARRAA